MIKGIKARIKSKPWNKGQAVGQKTPFTPDQADLIRAALANEFETLTNRVAQLAMAGKEPTANKKRRQAHAALRRSVSCRPLGLIFVQRQPDRATR